MDQVTPATLGDVKKAAQRYDMSPWWIYEAVRLGMPVIRLGRLFRFNFSVTDQWVQSEAGQAAIGRIMPPRPAEVLAKTKATRAAKGRTTKAKKARRRRVA